MMNCLFQKTPLPVNTHGSVWGMLPDNVTLGIPGITRSWSASKPPLWRPCAKVVWYHAGCVAGDGRELATVTSGGKELFSQHNQSTSSFVVLNQIPRCWALNQVPGFQGVRFT